MSHTQPHHHIQICMLAIEISGLHDGVTIGLIIARVDFIFFGNPNLCFVMITHFTGHAHSLNSIHF